jgi:hypothetical protein
MLPSFVKAGSDPYLWKLPLVALLLLRRLLRIVTCALARDDVARRGFDLDVSLYAG